MDSEFKKWMESLGFNGKEVTKAGAAIGIGQTSARERYQGKKDLSDTERLAMTAVAAGLPAWAAETAKEVETVSRILKPIQEALSERSAPSGTEASGHRIPEP